MSDGHGAASGARLRLARQARGFSQLQLAGTAGVSRQAVSAVESGISDPSLRVAITLARALGMTVEELFGAENTAAPVAAAPVAPLGGKGARVTLASMGDGYVALPLRGWGGTASRAGFLPAGGLVTGTGRDRGQMSGNVRPIGPPRPTMVAAGCDPALPLLEAPLVIAGETVSVVPCTATRRAAVKGLRHPPATPSALMAWPGLSCTL